MNIPTDSKSFSGRWLITGGLGFIGRRLIKRLLAEDNTSVKILDDESTGSRELCSKLFDILPVTDTPEKWPILGSKQVSFVKGDIRDNTIVEQAVRGADFIVHLAANTGVEPSLNNPVYDFNVNVKGVFELLEAIRKLDKKPQLVFSSSNAPLGAAELPANEKSPLQPLSPYGASKSCGEVYLCAYTHAFGLNNVSLRFGNVYGPGSLHKGSVVAKFIRRALTGLPLEVYGDGSQSRDFIYIDDLVNGIILAATTPNIAGETFQLSPGQETSVNEIIDEIVKAFNERGIDVPKIENQGKRVGDMQQNFSDVSKVNALLGWRAQQDLSEGLAITLDWFIDEQSKGAVLWSEP